jgi:hypothetical protein
MSRFQVQLSQNQIKQMDYHELETKLRDSAIEQIEKRDCAGIMKYLEPLYAERRWRTGCRKSSNVEISEHDFMASEKRRPRDAQDGRGHHRHHRRPRRARRTRKREIEYPVDRVLDELGEGRARREPLRRRPGCACGRKRSTASSCRWRTCRARRSASCARS